MDLAQNSFTMINYPDLVTQQHIILSLDSWSPFGLLVTLLMSELRIVNETMSQSIEPPYHFFLIHFPLINFPDPCHC